MSSADKMKSSYPAGIDDAVPSAPPAHHSRWTPKPGIGRKPTSAGKEGVDTSYTRTPALNSPSASMCCPSWVPKYCSLSR